MPNSAPSDIKYQPPIKGFSYSSPEVAQEEIVKKKKSIFFALGFEFLGLAVLFFVFLAVLNYFNILSLSQIYPNQLGFLPHRINSTQQKNKQTEGTAPVFLPQTNSWKASGTLSQYNDNMIQIKIGSQIIKLTFSYKTSMFYKQISVLNQGTTSNATTQNIPYTLYDLDKQINLGKKMEVYYIRDKSGNNIIQKITLLN